MQHSRAMQREIERNQRFFANDIEQPFLPNGKRNLKYHKIYGDQHIAPNSRQ